ncbi:MAG: prolipoprotein diacylglyceryl transferase [Oscillospiraceae bacterium]|jgi:phosphatidylglycerol:prolipoprotein diacylglycerol transferase|nr:prolipoprotein diacylglyceryl transferase [Oscillospiraceae bacterium]
MIPFVNILGVDIPMYSLMSVAGIAAVAVFALLWNKRLKLPQDDLLHIALFCAIGAIVGSKILHAITAIPIVIKNLSAISENPVVLLDITLGGSVFYGGLFGALLMMWIYCRRYKADFEAGCSLFATAAPLFHIFGRVGCFFAGCCYGVEVPWGLSFRNSISAPNGIPLLPIQLIESALNILIFAAMVVFQRKKRRTDTALKLYLSAYAVVRFTLEFFRGDKIRGILLAFSTSQWISAAVLLVCIFLTIKRISNKSELEPL